jgi:ABC-2 type transport system permease protein
VTQFGAILWAKNRISLHQLAAVRSESRLKIAVVGGAAILLWYGMLRAFIAAFSWLQNEGFGDINAEDAVSLADILMIRMLSIFAMALFFMLIFSNVLIAFSTLYKSVEVQYMLIAPLSIRTFFLSRFIECIGLSSWASAYLGSPLILAYGLNTHAHWGYYLTAVLFYLPFVAIPAALGSMITLILVRIFPRLPRASLFVLSGIVIVILFMHLRDSFNAERLAEDSVLTLMLQATSQTQSALLPSYWAAQGVLAAASSQYTTVLFMFLLLLSNALMGAWLAAELAHRVFRTGYSDLLGSAASSTRPAGKGLLGKVDALVRPLKNPYRALVIKDIKLFWRDPTQWTQFVIFFGIMAVYVANLGGNRTAYHSESYRSWVAALNSGACTLVLASLTSRFVYPLVSLEGFRFWILGLAPMTKKQLIWQKYGLSVMTTSPFTVGLTILSSHFLQVSPLHFAVSLYSIVLANLALAGLAVGLGSLYPNFQEDNPARIVSGMGGTLNFLLSVAYISLLVGSQMIILLWYVNSTVFDTRYFWWVFSGAMAFNTSLTILAVFLPMRLGLRNLINTEF